MHPYRKVVRIGLRTLESVFEHRSECAMTQEVDNTTEFTFVHPLKNKGEQPRNFVLCDLSGDVEIEIFSRHRGPITLV